MILVHIASSPPAAFTKFHTKPLVYISAAIKTRPRGDVPMRVPKVQGKDLTFCHSLTKPSCFFHCDWYVCKHTRRHTHTSPLTKNIYIYLWPFQDISTNRSLFSSWPVEGFCHTEIISRAKLGNLRQLGNVTAG